MKDIKIPLSTVKKLLIGESDLRANPLAIKKFHTVLINFAKAESKKIVQVTEGKKRKTIFDEDIE